MLNKVKEELPSKSDITKVDDRELQEIVKSTEDLISQLSQTDDLFEYPLRELLGLDKQLRNIPGSVKCGGGKNGSVGRTHQERALQA